MEFHIVFPSFLPLTVFVVLKQSCSVGQNKLNFTVILLSQSPELLAWQAANYCSSLNLLLRFLTEMVDFLQFYQRRLSLWCALHLSHLACTSECANSFFQCLVSLLPLATVFTEHPVHLISPQPLLLPFSWGFSCDIHFQAFAFRFSLQSWVLNYLGSANVHVVDRKAY